MHLHRKDKAKTVGIDGHAGHCRDVETPATAQLLTSIATWPERGLPMIERQVCLAYPFGSHLLHPRRDLVDPEL